MSLSRLGVVLLMASVAACAAEDDEDPFDAERVVSGIESPQKLTATAVSQNAIRLSWSDASSKERGFVIESRTGTARTYARVTSLPANASRFTHTGLTAGGRYHYRVATIDERNKLSAYATVSVTIPGSSSSEAPVPQGPRVIPVFITATDSTSSEVAAYRATFSTIVTAARDWYSESMGVAYGSKSYQHEPVRVLSGHYTEGEWEDFGKNGFRYPDGRRTAAGGGCSMYYGAEYELRDRGLLKAAGLPPLGDPNVVYFAINGGGFNGSCGVGAYLSASEANLLTNARKFCPTGRHAGGAAGGGTADCSSVGVYAHELGHGFGLPHCSDRATCTGASIMDNWWEFDAPNTSRLSAEDRADLAASKWMFDPEP